MKRLLFLIALIVTLAIPALANAAEGNFLVSCTPDPTGVHVADPIGGADHLHTFAGIPGISDTTTPFDMLMGTTTCQVGGESVGVWHPAVQAPDGTIIGAAAMAIYYRNPDASQFKVMPFPFGLKHVHGNPNGYPTPNQYAALYRCSSAGGTSIYFPASCPGANDTIEETMFFASCWDGLSLDETNDGLAHHTMTACDAAHPIRLPAINLIITWPHAAIGGKLTSDIEHGTAPGRSAHADYWATFNPFFQTKFVERCLNAGIQCRRGNGQGGSRANDLYKFGSNPLVEVLTPDETQKF